MSSKVAFQVHYGDFYRITHDFYGVNLSALERIQCSLDKPLERSFEYIRKCLHRMFNVNPKTRLLTVHTLTSWETNEDFWELTTISSTEKWQHYIRMTTLHARSSWKWVASRNGNSDSPEGRWFRWRVHTQHLTAIKRWKRIKKKRTCKLQNQNHKV